MNLEKKGGTGQNNVMLMIALITENLTFHVLSDGNIDVLKFCKSWKINLI